MEWAQQSPGPPSTCLRLDPLDANGAFANAAATWLIPRCDTWLSRLPPRRTCGLARAKCHAGTMSRGACYATSD